MIGIRWDDYELELLTIAKEIASYLQKSGASKADSEDITFMTFMPISIWLVVLGWLIRKMGVESA